MNNCLKVRGLTKEFR
jgi:ATP-binding cassette subfamily A (ABC1) protein 3